MAKRKVVYTIEDCVIDQKEEGWQKGGIKVRISVDPSEDSLTHWINIETSHERVSIPITELLEVLKAEGLV